MSANSEIKPFFNFLKNENYSQAIAWLEERSYASFEALFFYSIKPNRYPDSSIPRFNRGAFIAYFFRNYLHQSKYFKEVCNSSRKREWFEQLFMRNELICPLLYQRMAIETPNVLIEAIKRNRVPFLKQDHFTEILKYGESPELSNFKKLAIQLSISEFFYFANAVKSSKPLYAKSIEEILCLMSSWLYYYTWDLSVNKNNGDEFRLKEMAAVDTLNYFFTHFLRYKETIISNESFDTEQFQQQMLQNEDKKPPHYDTFLFWNSWNRYVSTFIDEFCFSDTTKVSIDENAITRKTYDPIEIEKYFYNGRKLYVYDQFEKNDFEEIGTELQTSEKQRQLLNYLSPVLNRDYRNLIDEFTSAIYFEKYKIPIEVAHGYATGFITPFHILFTVLSENKKKDNKDWKEILIKISEKRIHNQFTLLPLTMVNPDQKKVMNSEFFTNVEDQLKLAELTFEAFSVDLSKIHFNKHYNRFNEEVNLGSSLRFKLGNKTYSFPQISSSLRLHTFLTNLALKFHRHDNEQKIVNDKMEEYMSKLAHEVELKAVSRKKYFFKNGFDEHVPGEIDAVFFDNDQILGIEFKHSPLKSSLEEISREREITLETASRQLDRFDMYLKKGAANLAIELGLSDEVYFPKYKYTGLIITTNFEYDHEKVNGKYYKISWKEWIWILQNAKKGIKINEVLQLIEHNTYWEDVMGL